jgi:hypothetical protein
MTHERDPEDDRADETPDDDSDPLSLADFLAKHPDDRPDGVDDDLIRLAEENSRG